MNHHVGQGGGGAVAEVAQTPAPDQPEVPEGVIVVPMAGGDPEFKRIPLLGLRTDSDIHGHGFVRSFAMSRSASGTGLNFNLGLINSSQGERNIQLALKFYY